MSRRRLPEATPEQLRKARARVLSRLTWALDRVAVASESPSAAVIQTTHAIDFIRRGGLDEHEASGLLKPLGQPGLLIDYEIARDAVRVLASLLRAAEFAEREGPTE